VRPLHVGADLDRATLVRRRAGREGR
jgi:hypothetical protein